MHWYRPLPKKWSKGPLKGRSVPAWRATSNEAAGSMARHSASVLTTLSTSIGPWLTPVSLNWTMVTLAGAAANSARGRASSPAPPTANSDPSKYLRFSMLILRYSPECKGEGLDSRILEIDLDRMFRAWMRQPDQLVQPLLDDHTRAIGA